MKKLPNSTEYGTIWKLGDHLLCCGDSRDKELMHRLIGKKQIKSIISDPPYGVAVAESKQNFYTLSKNKVITNDHLQSDEEYAQFTSDWIESIKPYLARKNNFYIFNADKMVFALKQGMNKADIKFCQLLIWVKTHAIVGRLDYAPQHELIAYGWYGTHEFNKSKDKSILIYPKPNRSPYHPTTKPIPLIRHLILNSTKIGEVVCDPFLGSGTTLLACQQTKRICIGVELDPEYCQTIIQRYEKMTGIKAIKL